MIILDNLKNIATRENDSEAERINKSVLMLTVFFKSLGCIAWIVMYSLLDLTFASQFPMIYLGVLILTTFYLYKTKNFDVALYIYIAFILIIPFLLQLSLGGFVNSGAVILWSLLEPTGALFFKGKRAAIFWFALFIVAIILSACLKNDLDLAIRDVRITGFFFVMNISIVTGVLFYTMIYYRILTSRQHLELENNLSELAAQKQLIELKNKDITDSLNYAKRIQEAILPKKEDITAAIPESFVLYKPKDIVSGDFYYFQQSKNTLLIAAADCTGHGVPGALMSMIASEQLKEAASRSMEPADILTSLNKGMKASLQQSESDYSTRDGLDIALCAIDMENQTISYAGANRPYWLIRNGKQQLEEIRATKKAIGGLTSDNAVFAQHTHAFEPGDTIYLCTDGYADTFGGKKDKKLTTKRFKRMLVDKHALPMPEQEAYLDTFIEDWKAGKEQVDDMLVIGVRL